MRHLAILDDYLKRALKSADWNALPDEIRIRVFHNTLAGENHLAQALAEDEIIIAMRERTPFPDSLLARLPKLKLLVTTGMRNLSIDMQAARARGIDVCGTPMLGYSAFEHTWALLLALAKNIYAENQFMHSGGWQAGTTVALRGRTLGIIGLGKLGAQSARLARAFDMPVLAWSENLSEERAGECEALRVDKQTLLRDSDFILIHTLLSDRTRGLIGSEEFELMKPGAFLINTSRGPIVEEAALIAAIQSKKIAGAGVDVFDIEPLPADNPLRLEERILLTGHTAYSTEESFATMFPETLANVQAWLQGQPLRVLNPA